MKLIKKDGNVIARVYLFTNTYPSITDKDRFVSILARKVYQSSKTYAGWKSMKGLKFFLKWGMFGVDQAKPFKQKINEKEIFHIIEQTIMKCNDVIPSKSKTIFVFPCFHYFVKKALAGVSGHSTWKNTVAIFINPTKGWKTSLKQTLCHEFNHSIIDKYHKRPTLLDMIVFDGFAQNFSEELTGKKLSAPKSHCFSVKEAKKLFKKIEDLLGSTKREIQQAVFYEGKKYPLWSGYIIGYHIVRMFRQKYPKMKWKDIIQIKPSEILKKSGF